MWFATQIKQRAPCSTSECSSNSGSGCFLSNPRIRLVGSRSLVPVGIRKLAKNKSTKTWKTRSWRPESSSSFLSTRWATAVKQWGPDFPWGSPPSSVLISKSRISQWTFLKWSMTRQRRRMSSPCRTVHRYFTRSSRRILRIRCRKAACRWIRTTLATFQRGRRTAGWSLARSTTSSRFRRRISINP